MEVMEGMEVMDKTVDKFKSLPNSAWALCINMK